MMPAADVHIHAGSGHPLWLRSATAFHGVCSDVRRSEHARFMTKMLLAVRSLRDNRTDRITRLFPHMPRIEVHMTTVATMIRWLMSSKTKPVSSVILVVVLIASVAGHKVESEYGRLVSMMVVVSIVSMVVKSPGWSSGVLFSSGDSPTPVGKLATILSHEAEGKFRSAFLVHYHLIHLLYGSELHRLSKYHVRTRYSVMGSWKRKHRL